MTQTRSTLLFRVSDPNDSQAWREFVQLYEPLLMSYVRSRDVTEHDARDVVQEVFATLVRKLPGFQLDRSRGRFRTWLWRITQNAVTDWARKRGRRAAAERKAGAERNEAVLEEESPHEWLVAHRRRVLEFVLQDVRQQTRDSTWACFERHVLAGRSSSDVAAELGVSPNSVYVNASRVLARVREKCLEYEENLSAPS